MDEFTLIKYFIVKIYLILFIVLCSNVSDVKMTRMKKWLVCFSSTFRYYSDVNRTSDIVVIA